ncbi:hypothetical protein FBULB1_3905 [Fusarium bulbicola]|nr:hypothetical protein FBULB1_3905 [Fusarium bulbicola]
MNSRSDNDEYEDDFGRSEEEQSFETAREEQDNTDDEEPRRNTDRRDNKRPAPASPLSPSTQTKRRPGRPKGSRKRPKGASAAPTTPTASEAPADTTEPSQQVAKAPAAIDEESFRVYEDHDIVNEALYNYDLSTKNPCMKAKMTKERREAQEGVSWGAFPIAWNRANCSSGRTKRNTMSKQTTIGGQPGGWSVFGPALKNKVDKVKETMGKLSDALDKARRGPVSSATEAGFTPENVDKAKAWRTDVDAREAQLQAQVREQARVDETLRDLRDQLRQYDSTLAAARELGDGNDEPSQELAAEILGWLMQENPRVRIFVEAMGHEMTPALEQAISRLNAGDPNDPLTARMSQVATQGPGRDELIERIDTLESELRSAQDQANGKSAVIASMADTERELKDKLDEWKRKELALRKKTEEEVGKALESKREAESSESRQRIELSQLKRQSEVMESQLKDQNEKLQTQEAQIRQFENDQRTENELKAANVKHMQGLETEFQKLETTFKECQSSRDALLSQLDGLRKEVDAKDVNIRDLNAQVTGNREKLVEQEDLVKEQRLLIEERDGARTELEYYRKLANSRKTSSDNWMKLCQDRDREILSFNSQIADLKQKLKTARTQEVRLERTRDDLLTELRDAKETVQGRGRSIDSPQQSANAYYNEVKELGKQNFLLREEIIKRDSALSKQRVQLSSKDNTIQERNNSIARLTEQKTNLKSELQRSDDKVESLSASNEDLKGQVGSLTTQGRTLKRRGDKYKSALEDTKQDQNAALAGARQAACTMAKLVLAKRPVGLECSSILNGIEWNSEIVVALPTENPWKVQETWSKNPMLAVGKRTESLTALLLQIVASVESRSFVDVVSFLAAVQTRLDEEPECIFPVVNLFLDAVSVCIDLEGVHAFQIFLLLQVAERIARAWPVVQDAVNELANRGGSHERISSVSRSVTSWGQGQPLRCETSLHHQDWILVGFFRKPNGILLLGDSELRWADHDFVEIDHDGIAATITIGEGEDKIEFGVEGQNWICNIEMDAFDVFDAFSESKAHGERDLAGMARIAKATQHGMEKAKQQAEDAKQQAEQSKKDFESRRRQFGPNQQLIIQKVDNICPTLQQKLGLVEQAIEDIPRGPFMEALTQSATNGLREKIDRSVNGMVAQFRGLLDSQTQAIPSIEQIDGLVRDRTTANNDAIDEKLKRLKTDLQEAISSVLADAVKELLTTADGKQTAVDTISEIKAAAATTSEEIGRLQQAVDSTKKETLSKIESATATTTDEVGHLRQAVELAKNETLSKIEGSGARTHEEVNGVRSDLNATKEEFLSQLNSSSTDMKQGIEGIRTALDQATVATGGMIDSVRNRTGDIGTALEAQSSKLVSIEDIVEKVATTMQTIDDTLDKTKTELEGAWNRTFQMIEDGFAARSTADGLLEAKQAILAQLDDQAQAGNTQLSGIETAMDSSFGKVQTRLGQLEQDLAERPTQNMLTSTLTSHLHPAVNRLEAKIAGCDNTAIKSLEYQALFKKDLEDLRVEMSQAAQSTTSRIERLFSDKASDELQIEYQAKLDAKDQEIKHLSEKVKSLKANCDDKESINRLLEQQLSTREDQLKARDALCEAREDAARQAVSKEASSHISALKYFNNRETESKIELKKATDRAEASEVELSRLGRQYDLKLEEVADLTQELDTQKDEAKEEERVHLGEIIWLKKRIVAPLKANEIAKILHDMALQVMELDVSPIAAAAGQPFVNELASELLLAGSAGRFNSFVQGVNDEEWRCFIQVCRNDNVQPLPNNVCDKHNNQCPKLWVDFEKAPDKKIVCFDL